MAQFDTTHWSLVLRARSGTEQRAALESLCRTYRPPVLAYIRGRGYSSDTAEDLAQTFFTRFLELAWHANADPARGRFRAFLLTALKRFLINADVGDQTLKRGGGVHFEPLLTENGDNLRAASSEASPEAAFERSWAIAVLDAALARLRSEAEQGGRLEWFEQLQEFLIERPDEDDYARAAAALNVRRNTLAVAVHRLRHRLRELVREELMQTTNGGEDLESEMLELRKALGVAMQ
ncbi:MAG: sigma-70 family RNA polymerase sigma factor [Proteobacteria bacterium]|uniref:RNA polymerase sigma factor n=1 Tax=Rudaea sp. TaxID=2136325 RepID=UPI0032206414|nr:sigma-70 family RNA polymerase sigma factor [Pseudomonadota bacterium]